MTYRAGSVIILVTLLTFGVFGVFARSSPSPAVPIQARRTIINFMESRISRNRGAILSYLTKSARAGWKPILTSNPHITGYRITQSNPNKFGSLDLGGLIRVIVQRLGLSPKFRFTVRVFESYSGQPQAAYWDEIQTVMRTPSYRSGGGRITKLPVATGYLIDSIKVGQRTTVSAEQRRLILNRQRPLVSLDELPQSVRPIGAAPESTFGPGTGGFGPVAISSDGHILAFSTFGVHGFVGTVDVRTTDGRGRDARDGAVEPLDLYFEGTVTGLSFLPSLPGHFLAVEVQTPAGNTVIKIYNVLNRTSVRTGLDGIFPTPDYNVNLVGWRSETSVPILVINVDPSSETSTVDRTKLGLWEIRITAGKEVEFKRLHAFSNYFQFLRI